MNNLIVVGKNSNITVKNFDTIDEFQQYYNLHKDEIDKYTTTKLNRMFKIKDHKITRRTIAGTEGKTLCFRQLFKSELGQDSSKDSETKTESHAEESRFDELENEISELNSKIKSMEVDNIKIKNQLLEIIRVINE